MMTTSKIESATQVTNKQASASKRRQAKQAQAQASASNDLQFVATLFNSCKDLQELNEKARQTKGALTIKAKQAQAYLRNPFTLIKVLKSTPIVASLLKELGLDPTKKIGPKELGVYFHKFGEHDFAFATPCTDKAAGKIADTDKFVVGGVTYRRRTNTQASLVAVLKAMIDARKNDVKNARFSMSKLAKQRKAIDCYLFVLREESKYKGYSEEKLLKVAAEQAKLKHPNLF